MPITPQLSPNPGGILFVGEAPGDEELVKGHPFVGPDAGLILNQALRAARLTTPGDPPPGFLANQRGETRRMIWERRKHSFTYVFDQKVPRLGVKEWCISAKEWNEWVTATEGMNVAGFIDGADRTLPRITGAGHLRPEYHNHLRRLREEIEQCKPQLIVPLGGVALWALTGDASIDAYRGAINVSTRLVPGIKLLPSYDPKTVRATYKFLVPFVSDLAKARFQATFPEVRSEEVEIWLDPTLEDLHRFRSLYIRREQGPLSVDIETGGGQISCVSLSPTSDKSLIVPIVDYRQPDRSYWPSEYAELQAWTFLGEVLADPEIEKLFQNGGSYDVFWFLDRMGLPVVNYRHDLRLVHKALYPELPANLPFMAATHANTHAWKAGVSHHKEDEKRDA